MKLSLDNSLMLGSWKLEFWLQYVHCDSVEFWCGQFSKTMNNSKVFSWTESEISWERPPKSRCSPLSWTCVWLHSSSFVNWLRPLLPRNKTTSALLRMQPYFVTLNYPSTQWRKQLALFIPGTLCRNVSTVCFFSTGLWLFSAPPAISVDCLWTWAKTTTPKPKLISRLWRKLVVLLWIPINSIVTTSNLCSTSPGFWKVSFEILNLNKYTFHCKLWVVCSYRLYMFEWRIWLLSEWVDDWMWGCWWWIHLSGLSPRSSTQKTSLTATLHWLDWFIYLFLPVNLQSFLNLDQQFTPLT